MKKRKVGFIVLGAILLIICAVLLWQRENIKAGVNYLKYSSDQLSEKIVESDAKIDEAIVKLPEVSFRPLTTDEREQLRDGTLSEDDALRIMLEPTPPDVQQSDLSESQENLPGSQTSLPDTHTDLPASTAASELTSAPVPEATPDAAQIEHKEKYARISELIARIYVMRDSYVAKLESIKNAALAEYTSLAESERTAAKKSAFALRCVNEASELEAVCDSEMDSIILELTTLLNEVGGDTSIVSDIKAAYAEEKALKKAYYIDLYL